LVPPPGPDTMGDAAVAPNSLSYSMKE